MSASLPRRGPVQVKSRRSGRSIRTRKKPCSFFPMLRFRPSRPGERSRRGPQGPSLSDTASRELRKADPCGCCGSGCRRLNGRSSRKRAISRSSAATPQNCTGSMREPRRTSARSTKTTVRRSGYVFCRWAICRCETSCCPGRSHWKAPRAARSEWPEDSFLMARSVADSFFAERGRYQSAL